VWGAAILIFKRVSKKGEERNVNEKNEKFGGGPRRSSRESRIRKQKEEKKGDAL